MILKGLSLEVRPNDALRRRFSKYPVSFTDLARISAIVVRLKMSRDATNAVVSRTEGFESWNPAAPD